MDTQDLSPNGAPRSRRGCAKAFRYARGLERDQLKVSEAKCYASSARPAPARALSYDASTSSNASMAARSGWVANSSGIDGRVTISTNSTMRQIARQRRSIGMVFQRFNLFPHLTVRKIYRGAHPGAG